MDPNIIQMVIMISVYIKVIHPFNYSLTAVFQKVILFTKSLLSVLGIIKGG